MNGALIFLGVVVNSIGLCVFGEGIVHRSVAAGAATAGLFDGAIGLILINLGIYLIVVGTRRSGP